MRKEAAPRVRSRTGVRVGASPERSRARVARVAGRAAIASWFSNVVGVRSVSNIRSTAMSSDLPAGPPTLGRRSGPLPRDAILGIIGLRGRRCLSPGAPTAVQFGDPAVLEELSRMPIPTVSFTDERLPNGLRLIVAEDHLAPVVAVNIWYNVGSKNEVPGKTGFAHLFEHVMFQGSRNVAKAEHIALVQAAGGTMNGTTWLDRTNYFETMPSHQLELALWLEADRLGTLLDALSQENLDNQREVVKNEKRWSYDNRPYGSWTEKLLAGIFPEGHPYHHNTIGSMEDLDAASLDDVKAFFRLHYAPNNAVLSIAGDVVPAQITAWVEKYFGSIPANPNLPVALPDMT